MSTSCLFPSTTETAFRTAGEIGFDGIEVMITGAADTQSAAALTALSERHSMPILSVHAPVLFLTQFVWGLDARTKLECSAQLARDVGATTVVVHPPFRWQGAYVGRFLDTVRELAAANEVEIAVENMFPCVVMNRQVPVYAPDSDPSRLDLDAMTLDFSHAAVAGQDALELALRMGSKLRHVHLTDGTLTRARNRMFDEHLVPGHGDQPVREVLEHLARAGWSGSLVAEVAGHGAGSERERTARLQETLDFARAAIARGIAAGITPNAAPDAAAAPTDGLGAVTPR